MLGGALIPFLGFKESKTRQFYVSAVVLLTTILALAFIFLGPREGFTAIQFSEKLSLAFRLDGMGAVFGSLVAFLWPLATCYAFEYMKHEGKENKFFSFYTITFGVTLGIAFAANLLTLYLFYELLTLVTLPLVIHKMDPRALSAGKKYLIYSMCGAALIFIGLIFVINYGTTLDFRLGGVLSRDAVFLHGKTLRQVFVLTFFGFGVKAAMFPAQSWLPSASVAPTTVTALLHAVAVVKAGVFAIMRVTYFIFGTGFLRGTSFQDIVMAAALVTILYGSLKAFLSKHFKRRLAYSTISQLSYIILAATLMSETGLQSGLMYMIGHALSKIVLFYCAGAVLYQTHADRQYIVQLAGLGQKMPITFACFTIAALSLMGIPPMVGFVSKYELLIAIFHNGSFLAKLGLGVIGISIFLTAGYMLEIIKIAYFEEFVPSAEGSEIRDPNGYMTIPLVILTAAVLLLGFLGQPLLSFFALVATGGV